VERVGGYIRGRKIGQTCGRSVGPQDRQDRQASQTAFRLPLKTGEPVPLFGLQEKGWRHLRPPFHIGRAVPAEISELAGFENWGQKLKARKILGSKFEKVLNKGCT